jgi:hypothetical protein
MRSAVDHTMEDKTECGRSLLDHFMEKMIAEMHELMATRSTGKAGRKGPAYKYLKM